MKFIRSTTAKASKVVLIHSDDQIRLWFAICYLTQHRTSSWLVSSRILSFFSRFFLKGASGLLESFALSADSSASAWKYEVDGNIMFVSIGLHSRRQPPNLAAKCGSRPFLIFWALEWAPCKIVSSNPWWYIIIRSLAFAIRRSQRYPELKLSSSFCMITESSPSRRAVVKMPNLPSPRPLLLDRFQQRDRSWYQDKRHLVPHGFCH